MQSAYENRVADLQLSYDELNGALVSAEDRFKSTADELELKQNTIKKFLDRKRQVDETLAGLAGVRIGTQAAAPAAVRARCRRWRRAQRQHRRRSAAGHRLHHRCRRLVRALRHAAAAGAAAAHRQADQGELPGFRRRGRAASRACCSARSEPAAAVAQHGAASRLARPGRADHARRQDRPDRDAAHGAHPGGGRRRRRQAAKPDPAAPASTPTTTPVASPPRRASAGRNGRCNRCGSKGSRTPVSPTPSCAPRRCSTR